MSDLLALLDQLDQAHAQGTADGEWRFVDHRDRFGPDNRFEILDDEGSVAVCSDDNDATETTGAQRVALIVAAVNALPKLTAAVRTGVAALELVNRYGCENFTAGSCRDEHSGRTRDAQYGADRWCDACVAADALAQVAALTPEPVQP